MSLSDTCSLYPAHKDLIYYFVATFADSRSLASMVQPARGDKCMLFSLGLIPCRAQWMGHRTDIGTDIALRL